MATFTSTNTTRALRSRKRVAYLPGTGEDRNRYVRCWNCGFTVDLNQYVGGDASGIQVTEYVTDSVIGTEAAQQYLLENGEINIESYNEIPDEIGTIIETGPDGEEVTDYYTPRFAEAVGGCPFCGCRNAI